MWWENLSCAIPAVWLAPSLFRCLDSILPIDGYVLNFLALSSFSNWAGRFESDLVVLEYPMLHINFQEHWPIGSREGDFLIFLPYIGIVAILVMWPGPFEQIFVTPSHAGSTWILASVGLAVSKEKKFENVESEWPWTKVSEWPWPLIFI